jgi:hypothetical protein
MAFRFNKTLKQKVDIHEDVLEHNPIFQSSLKNKKIKLVNSFEEKNLHLTGYAIARWKLKSLIMAPVFMYLGYSIFIYTDPIQKRENKESEIKKLEAEKKILED